MHGLSPERWREVEALFDAALDLPEETRLTFLKRECRDDEQLFRDVSELVAAAKHAEAFLGDTAAEFAQPLLTAGAGDPDGLDGGMPERVGPYRVLDEIGRGGMGRVYLAERADNSYTRRVALKLIRRGMATEDIIRRFHREQQILASLEHRSIARLYDTGVSEDGRPYLAMEYVQGRSIDSYADDRRLSIEQRIRLFTDVCRAVQHAHQNLIVHRDLKPSNIVVTDEGQIKLLDFGIAKLLQESVDASSEPKTRTGVYVMTPEYAAPEQVSGGAITTATDVYALGIVLYELLTGRRPFNLAGMPPWEAQRIIAEDEPTRPSSAVRKAIAQPASNEGAESVSHRRSPSPERLARRLRGDLDTIVLTAIQKDPSRRYQTVGAFLDDLERYLGGKPVDARPDTALYRTLKFVARHRWGVAVAASFIVLLTAFTAALIVQLAATERERDRAAAALEKSERVTTFMTEIFREADPMVALGDTLNVYELLERAAGRAEEDLSTQPGLYAEVLQTMGSIYLNLADFDRAQAMLENALELHQGGDQGASARATTLEYLGRVYRKIGDVQRAVDVHERALDQRRRIYGDRHDYVAASMNELALSLHHKGEIERADSLFRRAIAIFRAGDGSAAGLGEALANLGALRHDVGDVVDAEPILREALAVTETRYGPSHPKVGLALSSLATSLQYAGNIAVAESLFNRALDINTAAFGEVNPNVSIVLNNLATIYDERGEHHAADSLYSATIRIDTQLLGADHTDVAITRHNYGLMLREEGRLDDAEGQIREAVRVMRSALGDDHLYTAILSAGLGLVVCENGKAAEGESILRGSMTSLATHVPSDHWRMAVGKRNLGACLARRGAFEEAEALLLEARPRLADELGPNSDAAREAGRMLAALYEDWGKPEQAALYGRR